MTPHQFVVAALKEGKKEVYPKGIVSPKSQFFKSLFRGRNQKRYNSDTHTQYVCLELIIHK